ncbi:MAG TPA: AI-2E family transporter [Vicinamibacterales bacterium]|jgi:predicted PurR-regulated permease PerM|nr:AI-2E family transporter [Vicinamibacterales bacterium]
MPERVRELLHKAAEPERETTAPTDVVDVKLRSVALVVIASACAVGLLYWAREVFIPIVLSVLISYALEPIVATLMRLRLPRVAAAAIVIMLFTGGLGYAGYALSDDAAAMVAALPDAASQLRATLRRNPAQPATIKQVQRAANELQRTADEASATNPVPSGVQRVQIVEPAIDVRSYVSWGSASAVAFAGQAMLVVFFVFFLLASGDLVKRKLVRLAGPSFEKKKITVQILNEIDAQIEKFLLLRVATSVIVGIATWLAFRWIGVHHAGLWGVAAGIFNSIPYFGPVLVAGATAVAGFLQFGTIAMALYVSGVSVVITSLEGWLLTPWLTSRAARTNEVAMFVGLIFWSFVWGIWGTLLAVPMLVVVKAFCDRIEDLKPLGELLGE